MFFCGFENSCFLGGTGFVIVRFAGHDAANILFDNIFSGYSFANKPSIDTMDKKRDAIIIVLFSIILTGLFHRQALGLNLLISEIIFFIWILVSKQFHFKGVYSLTFGFGLILSSIFTVLIHSAFSYILNFLLVFLFIGFLIYPHSKSLIHIFGQAISNIINSQLKCFKKISGSKLNDRKIGVSLRRIRVFIIPIFIIILFIVIYRNSNPVFDTLLENILLFFQEKWSYIFIDFDFLIIITFLISLFISIFIIYRSANQRLIDIDTNANEMLIRTKKKGYRNFRKFSLLNEYRSGVFLLVALNLVLFLLNVIDINWVWFGFEWEGQYLKQFVHEGTYLLILSIIISIILVLYYFHGNLNFYSNNKLLKYLSYIWLVQNGILTLSVAFRNFWYINYFSLAYKRIGVLIFLMLTLYGLYTVFVKVWKRKSAFYLFKTNSYAILLILIISSLFNWDAIIAQYNFKNSDKSFLHLDYLSSLSDKSLPYLDKPLYELEQIDIVQKEMFPFEQKFMSPEEYYRIIADRKGAFIKKWESKSILSWNLPEYLAYKKFFKENRERIGKEE